MRNGNGAFAQRQNDVYGAVLDSIYLHQKEYGHNSPRLWPVIEDQARCAAAVWRQPDQGLWETRGEPRHYVSSKVMCWVALDRAARLAARRGYDDLADEWRVVANEIHADVLANGLDSRGVFTQHYETGRARRLEPADPARPLPAAGRRAGAGDGAVDRRRADRERASCCATGPRRPTTGSAARRAPS